MRISGRSIDLLSEQEIGHIHGGMLRILSEMGMEIQNKSLLTALADFGLPVNFTDQRVRFPVRIIEQFLADAEKKPWDSQTPTLSVSAGVYQSLYQDPESSRLIPWTEGNLAFYFWLARGLPNVGSAEMLGSRLTCPPELEPLYERYYCWKYGADEGSSIYRDELCPCLLDLYQLRAVQTNKALKEVFQGTVYLVPPLKLGEHEAYQLAYFRERGLRVHIGSMHSLGGTAPVTLAGAVTLNLAEQVALRILDWAWFGIKRLHLGGSLAVMDMQTTQYRSAPVERAITILMNAQLARYYGATFSAHANLTDAKAPSVEAGAQKMLNALTLLMAGGNMWMPAGLLSADQICSPLQLVLDNEIIGALKRFMTEFQVNTESISLETIFEAGPGGFFFDKLHTARNYRNEIWQPGLWQRTMLQPWLDAGSKLDIDLARERVLHELSLFSLEENIFLSPEHEAQILGLIQQAARGLS